MTKFKINSTRTIDTGGRDTGVTGGRDTGGRSSVLKDGASRMLLTSIDKIQ